jgi:hypothetical protein
MFARSGVLWLALAILPVVSAVACIDVNGGAAELSWTLRDFEGQPISDGEHPCVLTNIGEIRLNWKAVTDDGGDGAMEPDGTDKFRCLDNRGVTGFVIPAGRQMLWIEPICRSDAVMLGSYEVPPPIVRTIEDGTVTTLDALLIVADPECTCPTATANCATASR